MFWFGKDKDKVQQWQQAQQDNVFNTEADLPISEIRGDTVIMKDWWIRAILKISGLNIDLKNTDEQEAIVAQYKRFLNGIEFPFQILIRNTYLELSDYINYMNQKVDNLDDSLLKEQGDWYVEFLDKINSKQWLLYVKEFYIVIPYYPLEEDENKVRKPWWQKFLNALDTKETPEKIVERYRKYIKHDKFLDTRVNVVKDSLQWVGIYAERLQMTDIIALLFRSYNPDAHKDQAVLV